MVYADTDISVIKLVQTAAQVSPGGIVEFNITVINNGTETLDPVKVVDDLTASGAGLTYFHAVPAPDTPGLVSTWNNIGSLAPGANKTILLNATVMGGIVDATHTTRNLTNHVDVTGTNSTGTVTAEDDANVTVYYVNITAVKANLTANVASQGGMVQYQINVTNTGAVNMTILVNDTLDSLLIFNSSNLTRTVLGQSINWTLLEVTPGETRSIYLNATVNNSLSQCQGTTNNLVVIGIPPDGNNVTATTSLTVWVCPASVSVLKLVQSAAQVSPGAIVQFNITLNNTGNVTLNVTLEDFLPSPGLTFSSAYPANDSEGPTWNRTMAPGASLVFYLNATVDPGAVNATNTTATLTNCINATGVPLNGDNVTSMSCAAVTVSYANISVIKINQAIAQPSPGGQVRFSINITNTGLVALDTVVWDEMPENLTIFGIYPEYNSTASRSYQWNFTLSPGQPEFIYINATVDAGAVSESNPIATLTNYVNATGVPSSGNRVFSNDSASVDVYYANVSVIKLDQTAQQPSQGGMVNFELNITNIGNVTLSPVDLLDDLPDGLDYSNANWTPNSTTAGTIRWYDIGPIGPGKTVTILLNATVNDSATATQCTVTLANIIAVVGYPPNGFSVGAENTTNVTVKCANVTLVKINQTALQASAGGVVQFNITVNNIGNVSLNGTVTDVLPPGLTFASAYPANTSAGPVWAFTDLGVGSSPLVYYINATVNPGVVNATTQTKDLINYANVTAQPPNGHNATAESRANVTVYYANVSAVKANLTANVASQGGMVQYQINVTNTGAVNMTILVNDTLDSLLAYNSTNLSGTVVLGTNDVINWTLLTVIPGETRSIYLNATVRNYPGQCQDTTNTLDVLGIPPNGNNVTATKTLVVPVCLANVTLVKINQTALQTSPGGLVQFRITITNTGNVSLNGTVTDVLPSNLTFASAYPTNTTGPWSFVNLAPGLTSIFYINATVIPGVVTQANPIVNLINYANVTAQPPNGINVTAEDWANVTVYYANVSVIKLDQTAQQPSPGGIVEFNITIKNEGNVTLDPLEVVDALPEGLIFNDATPYPDETGGPLVWYDVASLDPGDSYVVYVSAEVDNGVVNESTRTKELTNRVNVTGTPLNGNPVTAGDDANVTVYYADVSVVKAHITPIMPISPGGMVLWQINITNTGETNLSSILVMDTLSPGLVYNSSDATYSGLSDDRRSINWTLGSLMPTNAIIILMNSTANSAGTLYNHVDVIGYPANGDEVTDLADANVGINSSGISVLKTVSSSNVPVDANDTYTLVISNTGEVDLTAEAVDTLPENVAFQGSDVPETSYIGQVVTWSGISLPVGGSVTINYNVSANASGRYRNGVVVTGVPLNGDNVSNGDFAYFRAGATPPHDDEGGGFELLSISVSSGCDGNVVTVKSGGDALAGAEVKVNGDIIGNTNSKGQITFEGCGLVDATVLAKKSGYLQDHIHVDTVACSQCVECANNNECPTDNACTEGKCVPISCECGKIENHACTQYECCADSQCGQGEECSNHICNSPFECTKNTDCKDSEYCVIQAGQAGGKCTAVSGGCGVISNHAFTAYEFPYGCATSGCPACPSSYLCENNKCSQYVVTAPIAGKAGDNATLHVTVDGQPCSACDIVITSPDGSTRNAKTDESGNLVLPLNSPGGYKVSLPDGSLLKTFSVAPMVEKLGAGTQGSVTSTPSTAKESGGISPVMLAAGILVLLVVAAVLFFLWRREKPGNKPFQHHVPKK